MLAGSPWFPLSNPCRPASAAMPEPRWTCRLQQRTIQDQCSTGKDQITNIATHKESSGPTPIFQGLRVPDQSRCAVSEGPLEALSNFELDVSFLLKARYWHGTWWRGYIYICSRFRVPPPTPPAMVMVITHQPPPPCGMGGSWERGGAIQLEPTGMQLVG